MGRLDSNEMLAAYNTTVFEMNDRIDRLKKEIKELRELAYVPGGWHCPKCKFTLVKSVLHVQTGDISVDRTETPETCPNGCGVPLERDTWKQDAMAMSERMPDANCMGIINELREEEGSSVTLVCDNADFNGKPNCLIQVIDEWTDWSEKDFTGDTLMESLVNARSAKQRWKEQQS
jgi:hypothetical protein